MKKIIIVSTLVLNLFASDDYLPLSNLSQEEKEEYNFINKSNITEEKNSLEENNYKKVISKDVELETQTKIEEKKSENIDKDFVKEYKKENILKDEREVSSNSFYKDFSITPKVSYIHLSTNLDDYDSEKSHEILPELSFAYKNHTIKIDYLKTDSKVKDLNNTLDTTWYKIAYLYKINNANIGLAYNNYKLKNSLLGTQTKDDEKFATLELHLKNTENKILLEYGGFYGKNDSDIKNAYEYYLTLGYRIFDNDSLVFNAGYKNRTIEGRDNQIDYKGPIIGVSSTF